LKSTQKCIVELLRNRFRKTEEWNLPIDYEEFINILLEHKIFLHYYDEIIVDKRLKEKSVDLKSLYDKIIEKKTKYKKFLETLIRGFNSLKLNYYIYKGIALEQIIYGDKLKRVYGDIDVVIEDPKNVKYFVDWLKEKYNFKEEKENLDALSGELEFEIPLENMFVKIEIKTKDKYLLINEYCDKQIIRVGSESFYTFSLEVTYLLMVNYYYYFTENIYSIQFSNRHFFQHIVDLYNFLLKKENNLDWEKIVCLAHKYNLIHKIRISFKRIEEIFNDTRFNKYFSFFLPQKINYNEKDILDEGRIFWNISTFSRYFNRDYFKQYLSNYCFGEFLIGRSNLNYYNGELFERYFGEQKINYFFNFENKKIISKLNFLSFIPEEFIIYFQIYFFDLYGDFVKPFYPIVIRKEKEKIFINSSVINRNSNVFESCIEKRENNLEYVNVNTIHNGYDICIDLSSLNVDFKKKIGLNLIIYELKCNKVKAFYQHIPYQEKPMIIDKIKKTKNSFCASNIL